MSVLYLEVSPDRQLANRVECFWTLTVEAETRHRVLPDGCADLLFAFQGRKLLEANLVGVMTGPREARLFPGQSFLGVRIHPGGTSGLFPAPLNTWNDRLLPLCQAPGTAAVRILRMAREPADNQSRIEALQDLLFAQRAPACDVGERAIGERQARRLSLQKTGLSQTRLAAIRRFRSAVEQIAAGERNLVKIALDCGYYDQPDFTRHFQRLAGMTPGQYLRSLPVARENGPVSASELSASYKTGGTGA